MAESDKVVNAVMQATGESYENVSELCMVAHETVDECVTDDISVVAPPLVIGRLGCPVLDRLLLRLGDGQWQLPESVDVTEAELSLALMLPIETIARYPMIGRFGLLARCMDRLLIPDDDAERSLKILDAWLMTFAPERRGHDPLPTRSGRCPAATRSRAGCSRVSTSCTSSGTPYAWPTRRWTACAASSTCSSTAGVPTCSCASPRTATRAAADDWLVLENKTTAVGIGALDQLALSVDWLRAECRPGAVHGMLIADGLSLEVERGLRELRFDYQSMTGPRLPPVGAPALTPAPGGQPRRDYHQLPTELVGARPGGCASLRDLPTGESPRRYPMTGGGFSCPSDICRSRSSTSGSALEACAFLA